MAVFDLFSKRQRRARGELPEVYVYNKLPRELRVQFVHIVRDAFGVDHYGRNSAGQAYNFVNQTLCKEYGVFNLIDNPQSDKHAVLGFLLDEKSIERTLDAIEICFRMIEAIDNDNFYKHCTDRGIDPSDAILEVNERFKEHGVGFQFESGELIRVDSEFVHAEVVKPALIFLRESGLRGANEEFLAAHEHYRHSRYKECLVDCLKTFESTMKAICKLRGWAFQQTDTAKSLIAICLTSGLVPEYLDSQFTALRSLLESGIPTIRNKNGGHGQGAEPTVVPEYIARYALNMTATSVLFLADAHATKRK